MKWINLGNWTRSEGGVPLLQLSDVLSEIGYEKDDIKGYRIAEILVEVGYEKGD